MVIGLSHIVFGRLGLPRLKALDDNGVMAFELCPIALYGYGLVGEVAKSRSLGAIQTEFFTVLGNKTSATRNFARDALHIFLLRIGLLALLLNIGLRLLSLLPHAGLLGGLLLLVIVVHLRLVHRLRPLCKGDTPGQKYGQDRHR